MYSALLVQITALPTNTESILIKESLSVRNTNKLPLFAGVFTTPLQLRSFDVHLPPACGPRAPKSAHSGWHAARICDRI